MSEKNVVAIEIGHILRERKNKIPNRCPQQFAVDPNEVLKPKVEFIPDTPTKRKPSFMDLLIYSLVNVALNGKEMVDSTLDTLGNTPYTSGDRGSASYESQERCRILRCMDL